MFIPLLWSLLAVVPSLYSLEHCSFWFWDWFLFALLVIWAGHVSPSKQICLFFFCLFSFAVCMWQVRDQILCRHLGMFFSCFTALLNLFRIMMKSIWFRYISPGLFQVYVLLALFWKNMFAMTSQFSIQNCCRRWPLSFCLPRPNSLITPEICSSSILAFQSSITIKTWSNFTIFMFFLISL